MRSTIANLTSRLGLPKPDPFSQDWEIEAAESSKIGEWLDVYGSDQLGDDERALLMRLLVASYNDAMSDGSARAETWECIRGFLIRDKRLHAAVLREWALWDETDPDDWFPITPLIRDVAAES